MIDRIILGLPLVYPNIFVFVYTTGNFNSYDEYGNHLKSS